MHLLKPRLLGDGRGGMLVQWAEVPRELELLMNIDILVTEDYQQQQSAHL